MDPVVKPRGDTVDFTDPRSLRLLAMTTYINIKAGLSINFLNAAKNSAPTAPSTTR
jgi:hypothetical protein